MLTNAICEDVYALALALISWRLWSNLDTADCSNSTVLLLCC